jgi:predicted phage terminase large subunit-like protein
VREEKAMDLKTEFSTQDAALRSLVDFRRLFFAASTDVEPATYHYHWSDILLYGTRHVVVEAFRESAKTQIVVRANLLHALAFPLQRRSYIVLICATGRTASKKLSEISRELKADMALDLDARQISVLISRVVEDSANALEVECKEGSRIRIEAYGKGSAVRGLSWGAKRPDLVIIDDPQDMEDAISETVTDHDWDWFLSDVIFLGKSTRIFLIGNNLGERCIVERVIKSADLLGFSVMKVPIIDKAFETPAWPSRYTPDAIIEDRDAFAALGKIDVWYREKMCEVIAPDSAMFRSEDFRYYRPGDLSTAGMSIYMTVDPAASEADSADRTAVCVVGVNGQGHWFVLDMWADRKKPSDTIDAIFRLVVKWRPIAVGIEKVAYQAALADFLYKEMPRRNQFFNIVELKAAKRKELRIETALQPRFRAHSIWFPEMTPWASEIERELLAFPHGLHDDRIDALAYTDQIAAPPSPGYGGTGYGGTGYDGMGYDGMECAEMICDY